MGEYTVSKGLMALKFREAGNLEKTIPLVHEGE
jgi:hypothetical protein